MSNTEKTQFYLIWRLYTLQKEYKRAMPILQQVEFEDVLEFRCKSMLLRIYFEEKEYEAMFSLVKSFKTLSSSAKTLGIYKTRYKNMIHYCEKIYKHIGVSKPKKNLLKNEIETHANLPEKEWFL